MPGPEQEWGQEPEQELSDVLRNFEVFGSDTTVIDKNVSTFCSLLANIAVSEESILLPYEETLIVRYFKNLRFAIIMINSIHAFKLYISLLNFIIVEYSYPVPLNNFK